jgi:hypothetical protein
LRNKPSYVGNSTNPGTTSRKNLQGAVDAKMPLVGTNMSKTDGIISLFLGDHHL